MQRGGMDRDQPFTAVASREVENLFAPAIDRINHPKGPAALAVACERTHKVADLGDRELWLAFFRDSEENVMALMSEVSKA